MKGKKTSILLVFVISISIALSACGTPITLTMALQNSSCIKSCTYSISGNERIPLSSTSESAGAFASTLSSVSGAFDIDGKLNLTADKMQMSATVTAKSNGEKIEFPLYIDRSTNSFDFNLNVGIPDAMREYLGKDKTNLFLSSTQLDSFLKSVMSPDEYQKFDDSIKQNNALLSKATDLKSAIESCLQSYLQKNAIAIQKFEPIKGKSTADSGVFTITLEKSDFKAIMTEFLGNPQNYQLIKDIWTSASLLDQVQLPDAQTMITKSAAALDNLRILTVTVKFTVENKLVTGIDVNIFGINSSVEILNLSLNKVLSDINKAVTIKPPNPNMSSTLYVTDLLLQLMTSFEKTGEL